MLFTISVDVFGILLIILWAHALRARNAHKLIWSFLFYSRFLSRYALHILLSACFCFIASFQELGVGNLLCSRYIVPYACAERPPWQCVRRVLRQNTPLCWRFVVSYRIGVEFDYCVLRRYFGLKTNIPALAVDNLRKRRWKHAEMQYLQSTSRLSRRIYLPQVQQYNLRALPFVLRSALRVRRKTVSHKLTASTASPFYLYFVHCRKNVGTQWLRQRILQSYFLIFCRRSVWKISC